MTPDQAESIYRQGLIAAQAGHWAEAQELIQYLANSTDAGTILGVTRGTPANSEVRKAILPALAENDKAVVNFMDSISGDVVDSQLAPAGAATFTQTFQRYTSEVLFGRMTPAQAAKAMVAEVSSAL